MPDTENLVPALVLWWNASSFRVLCPFCLDSHGHGLTEHSRRRRERRSADCIDVSGGKSYRIVWPDEIDNLTDARGNPPRRLLEEYESLHGVYFDDPEEYRNGKSEPGPDGTDAITESLARTTLSDSQGSDPRQHEPDRYRCFTDPMADPNLRRKFYVSFCAQGDTQKLDNHFRMYPDDDFASYVNIQGANGVILAAAEENGLQTVELLTERGMPIDRIDHYGRTALMEAALWGRFETVDFLVNNGADVLSMDANGHRASDLAAVAERNDAERIERANGMMTVRTDSNRQRARIHALLCRKEQELRGDRFPVPIGGPRQGYFHKADATSLCFYQADTMYKLGDREGTKAFGRLDRGPSYPVISAMSGYSQTSREDTLNNKIWTRRAKQLCARIGHDVSESYASHVEKQLVAYYMNRHYIFKYEDEESIGVTSELEAVLPTNLPRGCITVSRDAMCPDCQEFYKLFQRSFLKVPLTVHCVGDKIRWLSSILWRTS
ncbi:ankyrin [Pseudovirgaria hyperparasitica]|uniref:Ankyrin n=1 Tax=Pseudovirgaria hyperparasitica TaxID=470096 RepID=A0A6A6WK60_9PEZI|nr:ankyrin [Pseudovirgaria hyperparasitica]KAF2762481.1 ankyrin [Pseudovirgaria hyperparasitica]